MRQNTNKYLGYFQLAGILVVMTAILIWCLRQGGMMPVYVVFAGILFLPFTIVSVCSLLPVQKRKGTMQWGIGLATFMLVVSSFFLPFFYEWGGGIIAIACVGIAATVWWKRKDIENQLLIFNLLGTALIGLLLISLVLVGLD